MVHSTGTGTGNDVVNRDDQAYMRRALELAERGRGRVSPEPLVGCVIVNGGQVVAEAWRADSSQPAAESVALQAAAGAASGATAYLTLEPAPGEPNAAGARALIDAGIRRVVVAALQPEPTVQGASVAALQRGGVEITTGVLQDEANRQNEVYRTNRLLGRPYLLFVTAMSLDGKVATRTGAGNRLIGDAARALVHEWRNEYDGVGIDVGTVLAIDPALTTRLADPNKSTLSDAPTEPNAALPGRTAIKVLFDPQLRTPPHARLFQTGPDGAPARVKLVTAEGARQRDPHAAQLVRTLTAHGAEVLAVPQEHERLDLKAALRALLAQGVCSLMLECDGELAWEFLRAEVVDRVACFVAPTIIGGRGTPGPVGGSGAATLEEAVMLPDFQVEVIGSDLLVTGHPDYPVVLAE